MANPYGQPDAEPAGDQPTQQFWVGPGAPTAAPIRAGQPGPGWPARPGPAGSGWPGPTGHPAGPGLREHLRPGRRKALHWTAGLLVAALLAGGGTLAGLRLAGHSSPAASPGRAGPATSAQQGALLNATLSDASSPGALAAGASLAGGASVSAAGASAGASANAGICARARHVSRVARRAGLTRLARRIAIGAARCLRARRRVFAFFLLRGVDGQFTVRTRQGPRTLAFERGVIGSASDGKSITVKASDGTTWTWDLVSTTVVRDREGKVSQSGLTPGTPVWVGGPVVRGAKDARLVVVRPPQPAPVPPSSAPGN